MKLLGKILTEELLVPALHFLALLVCLGALASIVFFAILYKEAAFALVIAGILIAGGVSKYRSIKERYIREKRREELANSDVH